MNKIHSDFNQNLVLVWSLGWSFIQRFLKMSLLSLLFLCRYWPVLEVEAPSQRGGEQDWISFEACLRVPNSVVWGSSFTWAHSLWNPSKAGGESKILISEKKSYLLTLMMSFREDGSLSLWCPEYLLQLPEHPMGSTEAFRWQRNKICSLSSASKSSWHRIFCSLPQSGFVLL